MKKEKHFISSMELLKLVFLKTLPVMTGYLVLGIGFGILMEKNGYGVLWSFAMSFFIYAGSMQYVAISLLTSGAGLISAALTTLMVNARHLFYGISMVEKYKGAGKKKPYLVRKRHRNLLHFLENICLMRLWACWWYIV